MNKNKGTNQQMLDGEIAGYKRKVYKKVEYMKRYNITTRYVTTNLKNVESIERGLGTKGVLSPKSSIGQIPESNIRTTGDNSCYSDLESERLGRMKNGMLFCACCWRYPRPVSGFRLIIGYLQGCKIGPSPPSPFPFTCHIQSQGYHDELSIHVPIEKHVAYLTS